MGDCFTVVTILSTGAFKYRVVSSDEDGVWRELGCFDTSKEAQDWLRCEVEVR